MKQILHIFKKDARHLRVEILISLAFTVALALIYPGQWISPFLHGAQAGFIVGVGIDAGPSPFLASLLVVLVPVSWWILITRVIQDENLVGDKQFWITRPYEWEKLLAAKTLFLLVFLYLPIFLTQCFLLKIAGFYPSSHMPGLLFNLLLLTGMIVLPLVALGTVTSSFAKMTLTILAAIAGFIGMGAIGSYFQDQPGISSPYGDRTSFPLLLCICIAVIVIQYFARRVWLSRMLLIVFPVLVVLIGLATPDAALIEHAYPRLAGQNPHLQIAFDPDSNEKNANISGLSSKKIVLHIPLKISGVAAGAAVRIDNVKISIESANGARWDSSWQSSYGIHLPGEEASSTNIIIDRTFYDQAKSSPATVHLTFALTELRSGQTTSIPLSIENFSVPRVGVCSPNAFDNLYITGISCRSALRHPELNYVATAWSNAPCSGPTTNGTQGAGWTGGISNSPADFSIVAVWDNSLDLSNRTEDRDNSPEKHHLCPGTPVTFTPYSFAGRTQADMTISDFQLPAYKVPGQGLTKGP